jgi:RNA polymerase sigma factor (TIGR02999 family)
MSEVTRIVNAIEQGDPHAAEQLLPLVYDELRQLAAPKLAQEKPVQTLDATALVHEAYLRLVDVEQVQHWDSRGHFFAAAAEAMRRILLNRARDKKRLKRGGDRQRIHLEHIEIALDSSDETCRQQGRGVWDFLMDCMAAAAEGRVRPSLLTVPSDVQAA